MHRTIQPVLALAGAGLLVAGLALLLGVGAGLIAAGVLLMVAAREAGNL